MGQDRNMQGPGTEDGALDALLPQARVLANEGGCADSSCPGISVLPDGRLLVVGRELTPARLALVPGLQAGETAFVLDLPGAAGKLGG